ncbi:MAG: hypothetical protein GC180_13120 [Bacteroidetes bacterium]|nr:hypothetical protein [Bacteroidota bacterium]
MKSKHIQVAEDNELLRRIHREINKMGFKKDFRFHLILLLKLFLYLGATCYFYHQLYCIQNPAVFTLTFVAYGMSLILFAINFSHDLSHDAIFQKKGINQALYTVIYTWVGAHAESWKHRHIHSHHLAPNVQEYDSDLQITKLIRVTPGSEKKGYHRFQHLYAPLAYTTYSLYWIFIKDPVILIATLKELDGLKAISYTASFVLQKLAYLSITLFLPLIYSGQSPELIFLAFLLVHAAQSTFLLFTFFMTHHVEGMDYPETDTTGKIQSSWMMNQIKSSNDMHPFSFWANFILGGFNNHIAHHLFPHIHHLHYPRLSRVLYQLLRESGWNPNQTTYWRGVLSHLRWLRTMGVE